VLAIVASVFLIFIGASLAFAGTVLMATFGTDGEVSTAQHPVTSPTAAVITDVAAIRATSDVADVLGTPVVNFAAEGGNASGLFLGIGRVADVDRYLAGVEIDQATDFELSPYRLTLARRDGAATAATPPAEQTFWVASASGTDGIDLSWAVQDGNYRTVLMNADGTPVVDSRLSVGVGLGGMFGLSLGLLIGGVVLILLAVALLVATRPRRFATAAPGPQYVPPGGIRPPTQAAAPPPYDQAPPPPPYDQAPPPPYGQAPPQQAPYGQAPTPAPYEQTPPPARYDQAPPPAPYEQAPAGPPETAPPAQPSGPPAAQPPRATPAPPIEPSPPVREPRS